MRKIISKEKYIDRVRGCFIGKTVIGTLGAPYEGVKMPMELKFSPEMVDTMLPNDDLDLQVLWLEVLEKKGLGFTSKDLLEAFCENCDYSPGEYAVMRKNYEKRIFPPYSGSFNNDFYRDGMGCPIRSEIWACISPGEPQKAAELAGRDGIIDHAFESVCAERYFAAAEALAFDNSDIKAVLRDALKYVPGDSRFAAFVPKVLELCEAYDNIKDVLTEILFMVGHPDCTNMFQNMGITIAALIFGEGDMIKTGMLALNCGFDTDCTCASAGALLGIILGEKEIIKRYGWSDIRYVLGVRASRRSDLVSDLADDIAAFAMAASEDYPCEKEPLEAEFEYPDGPALSFKKKTEFEISFTNKGDRSLGIRVKPEAPGYILITPRQPDSICLKPGDTVNCGFDAEVKADCEWLPEKNIIKLALTGDIESTCEAGLSGNRQWRLVGPIWNTTPPTDEKILEGKESYWQVLPTAETKAGNIDNVREFHLNMGKNPFEDYFTEEELFEALPRGISHTDGGNGLFARPVRVTSVETVGDAFSLEELCGFKAPAVYYMAQLLQAPEDMEVCAQVGYSSPFKLFVNGRLIGERFDTTMWDGENAHFDKIHLKKGENRIVMRLTRQNADAKYSLIFSKGLTCSTHYCCFATKRI